MGYREQRRQKWILYTLLFLLCFFAEHCVLNRYPLMGGVPLISLLTAAAVGFLEGSFEGALFGLGAGLLSALTMGVGGEWMIWVCSAAGFAFGLTTRQSMGRTLPGFVLFSGLLLAVLEGGQVALRVLFLKESAGAAGRIALWEGVYTLLWSPVIYGLFRAMSGRFRSEVEF